MHHFQVTRRAKSKFQRQLKENKLTSRQILSNLFQKSLLEEEKWSLLEEVLYFPKIKQSCKLKTPAIEATTPEKNWE